MLNKFKNIAKEFNINGNLVDVQELGGGNIHSTYVLTFKKNCDGKNNTCEEQKYIFQKINVAVFTEPYKLMNMIESITNHMNKKQNNGAQVLHVVKTKKIKTYQF